MRATRWCKGRLWLARLAPYLFVVATAAGTVGWIQHVAAEANVRICQQAVANRAVILDLIESTNPEPPPPGSDPALRAAIERAAVRAEEFKAYARVRLGPPPVC